MEATTTTLMAKRIWGIVRIIYYMFRKSISKRKLMLDVHMLVKRGKLAGKAIGNIIFHHNSREGTTTTTANVSHQNQSDVIFSCGTSSRFGKRKRPNGGRNNNAEAVKKAFKILNSEGGNYLEGDECDIITPLRSFGKSPAMVRQLRITDSPFPLVEEDDGGVVDKEAGLFIERFYSQLRQQYRVDEVEGW